MSARVGRWSRAIGAAGLVLLVTGCGTESRPMLHTDGDGEGVAGGVPGEAPRTTGTGAAETCVPSIPLDQGTSCLDSIQLPDLTEGMMETFSLELGGPRTDVWYRFGVIDTRDTTCDELHIRARIVDDPGMHYALAFTWRCDWEPFELVDHSGWFADGREGRLYVDVPHSSTTDLTPRISADGGQCPCHPLGEPGDGEPCVDNSGTIYVRLRRLDVDDPSCAPVSLEISNSVYSAPF